MTPDPKEFADWKRVGKDKSKILVEFLARGKESMFSTIIHPKWITKSKELGVWINVNQTKHDRGLLYLARRLRSQKAVNKAYCNAQGITIVEKNGIKKAILKSSDLQEYTIPESRSSVVLDQLNNIRIASTKSSKSSKSAVSSSK